MARVLPRTEGTLYLTAAFEEVQVLRELLRSPDERIRLGAAKALVAFQREYTRILAQLRKCGPKVTP